MCQILIRMVDRVNPNDVLLDERLDKRGDAIFVAPDNWQWSQTELTNPEWRILSLPNVTVSEASQYLSGPAVDPLLVPYRPLRGKGFLVDTATGGLKNYLADNTRSTPIFTSPMTAVDLAAWSYVKTIPPDPRTL
jgi:hypothetical protein